MNTYDIITQRLIDKIESGNVLPWHKPWKSARNMVSGKAYRGINAIMLGSSKFSSPYWLTYKQAKDLGGTIKADSKSDIVVYFTVFEKKDDAGNVKTNAHGKPLTVPFLKYSNLFNLEQTEGIEAPKSETQEACTDTSKAHHVVFDAVAAGRVSAVSHQGARACYMPSLDEIRMPGIAAFDSPETYYHTLFHEATHSTGHRSRLDRDGITNANYFGSDPYAKEELIAELGASFLSNETGILEQVKLEHAASYLDSWIAVLKRDTRLIVSASSSAQKAADYIRGQLQS